MPGDPELVWFRSVPGRALARFGSGGLLGCTRVPGGHVWADAPVAIARAEYVRYRREYDNAIRRGDLLRADPPPSAIDEAPAQGANPVKQSRRRRSAESPVVLPIDDPKGD